MSFIYTKPVVVSRANKKFKLPVLEVPHLFLTGFPRHTATIFQHL